MSAIASDPGPEIRLQPDHEDRKCGVGDYKFPEVLLRAPRCLIALSGLDITNNAIHRLVWEEFSSGTRKTTDRKPILFKNFQADHLYPKCGPNVRIGSYPSATPTSTATYTNTL
jgi:hypothetical protein